MVIPADYFDAETATTRRCDHGKRGDDYCVFCDMNYELKLEPNALVTDTDTILRGVWFYTRKEAADFAVSIGWPRNSARRILFPFGRQRFAVSDSHNNILVRRVA